MHPSWGELSGAQPPAIETSTLDHCSETLLSSSQGTELLAAARTQQGGTVTLLKLNSLFIQNPTPNTFIDGEKFPLPDASVASINECFCFHQLKQHSLQYLYFISYVHMFPKPTAWFLQNSRSFD